MIFTEVRFAVLFALCWLSFFGVRRDLRAYVLTFWGMVFYLVYAGSFLPVVVGLALATLVARGRIGSCLVGAGVVALFGYFKWGGEAGSLSVDPVAQATTVALVPLGFSFLAFELLHVVIERQRGRSLPVSARDLFAFIFFFPARAAGPIKRYGPFTKALSEAEASFDNVYQGLLRVLRGLFKKLVLADLLSMTVSEQAHVETAARAWAIVLAFSLQIYLDFSAYSDVAIGFSRMLGIQVPENFDRPYFALNIKEFWNRWHMTLSNWVRDYIFMPIGSRLFRTRLRSHPVTVAVISYLLTFLVVGLWHGVAWTFVVWGLYHGLLLGLYHVYAVKMPRVVTESRVWRSRFAHYAAVGLTFLAVTIGWVPFMTSWSVATRLLGLMFGFAL